jgi:hypothetical protein
MTLTKFLPSGEGAVKIAVVTIGVLAVLTYVVPVLWGARLGIQPLDSKLRLVK